MAMDMGGAITAVAATTTVGIGATTMAGGIITIGGDFYQKAKKGAAVVALALREQERRARSSC